MSFGGVCYGGFVLGELGEVKVSSSEPVFAGCTGLVSIVVFAGCIGWVSIVALCWPVSEVGV